MSDIHLDPIISQEYHNIRGSVILKDGSAVYRRAFHGYDLRTPIHVASLTKSVLSALIGIAVQQGLLPSLAQPILSFFPEYRFKDQNENRRLATVRHLLNMTVPYSFPHGKEPLELFSTSPDWVRFALEQIDPEGQLGAFQYSTQGAHLLSAILTHVTGKSALEFANQMLFGPIGMSLIPVHPLAASELCFDTLFGTKLRGWANDPQGITAGGWGLTTTVDDLAKFGLLYLNQGNWKGRQILPPSWVALSSTPNANHYSYLWWQLRFGAVHAFAAMGDGGNVLCCIPERGLVIAIVCAFSPHPKDPLTLIQDHILPLFD